MRAGAILSACLCLVPLGAHLFEMPNKLALGMADYMVVQRIYAGWALFGVGVILALAFTLALAAMLRPARGRFRLCMGAALCIAGTQAIFWLFTFPTNAATHNWTQLPADPERARRQWEYSHAASAVLMIAALVMIVVASQPQAVPNRQCDNGCRD